MIEVLKTDFEHKDDRGQLVQLVHKGYEQVNVLISNTNTLRGGHYHKEVQEAFYVISGSVVLRTQKDGKEKDFRFASGDFFMISPYTVHSMEFPEHCVMVQLYDRCVEREDGTKDIYTVEVS